MKHQLCHSQISCPDSVVNMCVQSFCSVLHTAASYPSGSDSVAELPAHLIWLSDFADWSDCV